LPAEADDMISDEEAKKIILDSQPQGKGTAVADDDQLGIKAGSKISVETTESVPAITNLALPADITLVLRPGQTLNTANFLRQASMK
jgi:hypothetical protein